MAELIRIELGAELHPRYLRQWPTKLDDKPHEPAGRARRGTPPGAGGGSTRSGRASEEVPANKVNLVTIDESGLFLDP